MPTPQLLSHRAIISVSGADAETFLNGLLTMSVSGMTPPDLSGELRYGALLTPQGKIIADMLIVHEDGAFLIDCDGGVAANLLKRLNMFRLRAKVDIAVRKDLAAIAFDGASDPREPSAPRRRIGLRNNASASDPAHDAGEYHAARIAAGLAEQGSDFASEDVFPADINMDLIGGVDFRKGCFVGQEVVSRMKRRGNARRRTLKAAINADISVPAPVLAGTFEIGTLTSFSGGAGLARLRIDRLAEAQSKAEPITANGVAVAFDNPPWLAAELAALKESRTS
jgi:tRNA-modifying protein YgfZ